MLTVVRGLSKVDDLFEWVAFVSQSACSLDYNKLVEAAVMTVLFILQDKDAVNGANKYGHNFRGLYCICNRPYPDPDDEVSGVINVGIVPDLNTKHQEGPP